MPHMQRLALFLAMVAAGNTAASADDRQPFTEVGDTPVLVAPGVVSTGDDESHATLSPDGKTLYFLKNTPSFDFWTIVASEWGGTTWRRPRTLPFSGRYPDADLVFSPDGRYAYFISKRPLDGDGDARPDTEIWRIETTTGGWGEPEHVPALSSPGNEWLPTFADDGTIYFGSDRPGGFGGHDIWRARLVDGAYQAPENVGAPVNSAGEEIEALVTPDGDLLVIAAKGRDDGLGQYDLYVSRRCGGNWQAPRNPGAPLNSTAWDFAPHLSPDGRLFFFASNRGFGTSSLDRALRFDELERRIRSSRNGLRDIYVVSADTLRGSVPACGGDRYRHRTRDG